MGDAEGDWCAPALLAASTDPDDDEVLVEACDAVDDSVKQPETVFTKAVSSTNTNTSSSSRASSSGSSSSSSSNNDNNKNSNSTKDDFDDMEDESLALDDMATLNISAKDDGLVKSRRYDVSITYDNYYRVPRMWLFGFNEDGSVLSTREVYQDIVSDFREKTVTVDPHPHLSSSHASIHPCQHAPAMLGILAALKECGGTPNVEQYLFIFIKVGFALYMCLCLLFALYLNTSPFFPFLLQFMQSVVPTINYDFTTDVQVGKIENDF
jgi:hypothetical protein